MPVGQSSVDKQSLELCPPFHQDASCFPLSSRCHSCCSLRALGPHMAPHRPSNPDTKAQHSSHNRDHGSRPPPLISTPVPAQQSHQHGRRCSSRAGPAGVQATPSSSRVTHVSPSNRTLSMTANMTASTAEYAEEIRSPSAALSNAVVEGWHSAN